MGDKLAIVPVVAEADIVGLIVKNIKVDRRGVQDHKRLQDLCDR